MSRNEIHGGGTWSFGNCLWSPSLKQDGVRWGFWETLLQVKADDLVLHLKIGENASFVGFSAAETDGFETEERPPDAGQWDYAQSFYYVPLKNFTYFEEPLFLDRVFEEKNAELRSYFLTNKSLVGKRKLFYVIQAGKIQCLNGAYLTEVDEELSNILLYKTFTTHQEDEPRISDVKTNEQMRSLLVRVGQQEFSDNVRSNYNKTCCFPECSINEDKFVIGAHIARWADSEELRGQTSNGLCLCLMHDKAFETGLFTINFDLRIWVNRDKIKDSAWAKENLLPYHGKQIKKGNIAPSEEALISHWKRTQCYPEFD